MHATRNFVRACVYACVLVLVLDEVCAWPDPLAVFTFSGVVVGKNSTSGKHRVWNTIPYAAPPVGENRWLSPQPVRPWLRPLDTTITTPLCPQVLFSNYKQSEDCLYLSVYAPASCKPGKLLPVQVFIHGGSFTSGGAVQYNGEFLSGDDIIFVAINYRLGVLGNFAHPVLFNTSSPRSDGVGYYSIQDQRAALQWVRHNIAFFGGDPSQVTLSGESAGAISVCAHLTTPRSYGLFNKAISESGFCGLGANETGVSFAVTIANAVGCTGESQDTLSCLLRVPAATLAQTSARVASPYPPQYYPPSPSSPTELLDQPYHILRNGGGHVVPLLIGTNLNETSLTYCPIPGYNNLTPQTYAQVVNAQFPATASELLKVYPVSDYPTPTAAFVALTTDQIWNCPSVLLADITSSRLPKEVFFYHYTHAPEAFKNVALIQALFGVSDPTCLNAAHEFELEYLFNYFDQFAPVTKTAAELTLQKTIRNAWVSFVKNAVPTLPNLRWPVYKSTTKKYVNLDTTLSVGTDFRGDYCDVWVYP